MHQVLKELSATVRYTEPGSGACKRIYVGRGLSEDQCDNVLEWIRRYPELLPDSEALLLLPDIIHPESLIPFALTLLGGLDRVWALLVSDAWWNTRREQRESEFVQMLLLHSLVESGILMKGATGPILLEEGEECQGKDLEARVQAKLEDLLQRGQARKPARGC